MHTNAEMVALFADLAAAAAEITLPHFRAGVEVANKASCGFDPVTVADHGAETAMRALIERSFPDHGIVGEEGGSVRADADFVWTLDPIDGTRAFIAGIPLWGTLIGLTRGGRPVAGMMAQPFIGEQFFSDGATSRYRGPGGSRVLATRSCAAIGDAILCTTSPDLFSPSEQPRYAAVEREVRLARYGTDCYAYCLLAAGHVDAVIEAGLGQHDIVALIPIIEAAGGRVTSWNGGTAAEGGQVLATGDPRLHELLLSRLGD